LPGYGREIPLSWLKALDRTTELVNPSIASDFEPRVREPVFRISLAEFKGIARDCLMQAEEVPLMLALFTDLGLLMHQHDDPDTRELVVLKPQWLLDMMRELLCVRELQRKASAAPTTCCKAGDPGGAAFESPSSSSVFSSFNGQHNSAPEWRNLLRHGRLDADALSAAIWPQVEALGERKAILALMERFSLCCKLPVRVCKDALHHTRARPTLRLCIVDVYGWRCQVLIPPSGTESALSATSVPRLHIVPSLLPAWTPSAIVNVFRQQGPQPTTSTVFIRAIHADAHWEFDSYNFLPEGVFFALQVSARGRLFVFYGCVARVN